MSSDSQNINADLTKQKKAISKIQTEIKKYNKLKPTSINQIFQLNKTLENIKKTLPDIHPIELRENIDKYITKETKTNHERLNELEKTFGKELYEQLKKHELKLEGHLPLLKVNYYGLNLDLENNRCKIYYGWDEEQIGVEKIDPIKITEFITNYESKLEKTSLDPSILLKSYNKIVKQQKNTLGKKVPIVQLLLQVAIDKQNTAFNKDPSEKNYKSYDRVQFSHDLYKLKRDKKLKIRLHPANRAQVKTQNTYLWIPITPTSGQVYSHIELMEESL